MADRRVFVDVFGEIVAAVRERYDIILAPGEVAETPYYEYGHFAEIVKILCQKDEVKEYSFPLVILVQDFEEKNIGTSFEFAVSPRVLIVAETKQEYSSKQRYDNVFKTVLYPIYKLLREEICNSSDIFQSYDHELKFSKHDRLFWGTEQAGNSAGLVLNEFLDAIDIKFSELNVFKAAEICIL